MPPIEIAPDVFWVGVNDRETDLFESMWPIQESGVSYNTYLIRDEKNVVIDLSKEMMTEPFIQQLKSVIDPSELDYIILNHMEPDHTGALTAIRELAPDAVILGTPLVKGFLQNFYNIAEGFKPVSDGETISLGKYTLQFAHTPNVHWPETMMTYLQEEKILFSCDGFGGYGTVPDSIFDDTCENLEYYERESLRYFATIVSVFSKPVLMALKKLSSLEVSMIAPSHGLIWRGNPGRIVELYRTWSNYARGPARPEITLLYGSMYGNTARMADAVAEGIERAGVPFVKIDVARTEISRILPELLTRQGVFVAAPTYEGELFPPMAAVLRMAAQKRIRSRLSAWAGSYGWKSAAESHYEELIRPMRWEKFDGQEFAGAPMEDDLAAGVSLGEKFAEAVKASVES